MSPAEMTETELALELQYLSAAIPHLSKMLRDALDARATLAAEKGRRVAERVVAA